MQLSYSYEVERGYHGQKAENYPNDIDTAITAGAYPVGVVVVTDRTANVPANQVKLPAAAGDLAAGLTVGVLLRVEMAEPGNIPAGAVWPVLRKGRVWLNVEGAVTKYASAFVRHTASGALTPGSLRADANTDQAVQVAGIRFLETRTTAGLCLVEVHL